MTRSMMLLIFFVPSIALAVDDPIKAELGKARDKYAECLDAAKTKFVAAIEAKLKEVAGKGDLDGATQLKSQKEQFEKDGTVPKAPQAARARTDYESEIRSGRELLRKAIEKAKDAYTKALKLDEAQALAAEFKAMAVEAKGGAANTSVDLNAKFADGSVWKGKVNEKRGSAELMTDAMVTVTKRKGQTFEGTYEVAEGKYIYLIEGSILLEQLSFKITKIEKQPKDSIIRNLIGVEYKGVLRLDPKARRPSLVTNYTWRNANDPGVSAQGMVTLVLEK